MNGEAYKVVIKTFACIEIGWDRVGNLFVTMPTIITTRIFPRTLTSGGLLTTDYRSRTIGYFPQLFSGNFVGGTRLRQSRDRGISPVPPPRENPEEGKQTCKTGTLVNTLELR